MIHVRTILGPIRSIQESSSREVVGIPDFKIGPVLLDLSGRKCALKLIPPNSQVHSSSFYKLFGGRPCAIVCRPRTFYCFTSLSRYGQSLRQVVRRRFKLPTLEHA